MDPHANLFSILEIFTQKNSFRINKLSTPIESYHHCQNNPNMAAHVTCEEMFPFCVTTDLAFIGIFGGDWSTLRDTLPILNILAFSFYRMLLYVHCEDHLCHPNNGMVNRYALHV
jgi:hypothetical protein